MDRAKSKPKFLQCRITTMGITDHINDFQDASGDSDRAFAEIVDELQAEVRKYVAERFPKELNAITQVTDFVDKAFLEARKRLSSGRTEYVGLDRNRITGLLKTIARGELSDAKKKEKAAKRTKGDTSELNDQTTPSRDSQPVEKASKNEARITFVALLIEGEKPIDQLINVLGLGLELSPRQIEEVFRKAFSKPPKSQSAILRRLNATKARLLKRLTDIELDQTDD